MRRTALILIILNTSFAYADTCSSLKADIMKEKDSLRTSILQSYEANYIRSRTGLQKLTGNKVKYHANRIAEFTDQWKKENCTGSLDESEIRNVRSRKQNPLVHKFYNRLEKSGLRLSYNVQRDVIEDTIFAAFSRDCSDVRFRMGFLFTYPFDIVGSCNGTTDIWDKEKSTFADMNSLWFYLQKPAVVTDGLVISILAEKNLQILCEAKDLIIQNKPEAEIKKKMAQIVQPCQKSPKKQRKIF